MVDFALSEEQEELRRVAREFAQNEIAPVAMAFDKTGEFPWEIHRVLPHRRGVGGRLCRYDHLHHGQ